MIGQGERPWLEIPAPGPPEPRDPEGWENPKTRGDKDHDETLDDERRVIIIDL